MLHLDLTYRPHKWGAHARHLNWTIKDLSVFLRVLNVLFSWIQNISQKITPKGKFKLLSASKACQLASPKLLLLLSPWYGAPNLSCRRRLLPLYQGAMNCEGNFPRSTSGSPSWRHPSDEGFLGQSSSDFQRNSGPSNHLWQLNNALAVNTL